MPPNAAATESWKNRSGSASVATRVWVWTSTMPGSTRSPVASTTSRASAGRQVRLDGRDQTALDGDIRAARAVGGDDGAAAHDEVGHGVAIAQAERITSDLDDLDLLGALPEAAPADLAQAVLPAVVGHDRGEVVRRELADLRRVVHAPYGKKISHSLMPPG